MKKSKKQQGNIGDLLSTGICILTMTVMVFTSMRCTELIWQKTMVGQIARKYILRMETVGYLARTDQDVLKRELEEIGVTEMDLTGSTISQSGYGTPIVLRIRGKLGGEYGFEEKRVSTAKY